MVFPARATLAFGVEERQGSALTRQGSALTRRGTSSPGPPFAFFFLAHASRQPHSAHASRPPAWSKNAKRRGSRLAFWLHWGRSPRSRLGSPRRRDHHSRCR